MALPVTRTFSGALGNIPTADETQWAYNRNSENIFAVVSGGWCQISDTTVDLFMHWTGDTFTDHHFSDVIMGAISVAGTGVGRGYGPACRCTTATTQKTGYRWVLDSHGWELGRCDNPTFTSTATGTEVAVKGDHAKMIVYFDGTNDIVSLLLNGVHVGASPYTITSPLTGGAPGVAHSSTTSSGGLSDWGIDSVTMGDILVAQEFENVTVQSAASLNVILNPNVSDSTAINANAGTSVKLQGVGFLAVSLADNVGVAEAVFLTSGILVLVNVSDSTAVTEAVTPFISGIFITVSDSTTVTEAQAFTYAQDTVTPIVNDAVVMLDLVGGIASFQGLAPTTFDTVSLDQASITVSWTANTESDLAGYKVYVGTASTIYTLVYDVGLVTSYIVTNLTYGTLYYIVVTAYDTAVPPNESGFSSPEQTITPVNSFKGNVMILAGPLSVNDASAVTDVPVINLLLQPKPVESAVVVTENHSLLRPFNAVAPFDTVTMSESLTFAFSTFANLTVVLSDATTITESDTANFSGIFSTNDATAVTDGLKVMLASFINVNDVTGITDASTALIVLSGPLAAFETVTVVDACTVRMDRVLLTVSDSTMLSDGRFVRRAIGVGGALNEIT